MVDWGAAGASYGDSNSGFGYFSLFYNGTGSHNSGFGDSTFIQIPQDLQIQLWVLLP